MSKSKVSIVIVGYGVVGHNMKELFPEADVQDPQKGLFARGEKYDVAIVCVPTPSLLDGSCDVSIVREVVMSDQLTVGTWLVRSTVPPGTCRKLQTDSGKVILFCPEYYGETVHANEYPHEFLILGGADANPREARVVEELWTRKKTGEFVVRKTTWETAELAKYMENCFLATKVTFCIEFAKVAEVIGVEYSELRELWLLDKRIGRSHTFVYEDQPYYDSVCLNKDVPAFVEFAKSMGIGASLVSIVNTINEVRREEANKHEPI